MRFLLRFVTLTQILQRSFPIIECMSIRYDLSYYCYGLKLVHVHLKIFSNLLKHRVIYFFIETIFFPIAKYQWKLFCSTRRTHRIDDKTRNDENYCGEKRAREHV